MREHAVSVRLDEEAQRARRGVTPLAAQSSMERFERFALARRARAGDALVIDEFCVEDVDGVFHHALG
jgi:hypothetical protein